MNYFFSLLMFSEFQMFLLEKKKLNVARMRTATEFGIEHWKMFF